MTEPKVPISKEGATAMLSRGEVGRQAQRMMPGDAACRALLPGAGKRDKRKTSSALSPTPAAPLTLQTGMERERVSYRAVCHPDMS